MKNEGYSLDRLTSGYRIKSFDLGNQEGYLPSKIIHDFLIHIGKEVNQDRIQPEFYKDFPITHLGPYGQLIVSCSDLMDLLDQGLRFQHFFQTNQLMRFEICGTLCRFSHTHLDRPSEGRLIAQKTGFSMIIQTFKTYLGKDWAPEILEVPGRETKWLENMFDEKSLGKIRWRINRPTYAFYFKTDYLTALNPEMRVKPDITDPLVSTTEKVKAILSSYKEGIIPTLYDFSNYFDLSERSLDRALRQEGNTFSKLLTQNRSKRALILLKDHVLSINEIGMRLGYANTPNFIRAFKNWTGLTPESYRNAESQATSIA
jgi:AraC-like DNA-binding protein